MSNTRSFRSPLDQSVGLMVWSPLHAGLLTGKFRRDTPRPTVARLNELDVPGTVDFDRLYRIVDVLDAIARHRSVSISQVALNWVLHKPGVDTVILGARNEEQLRDNLAAQDGGSRRRNRLVWTRSVRCPSRTRNGISTNSESSGIPGSPPSAANRLAGSSDAIL